MDLIQIIQKKGAPHAALPFTILQEGHLQLIQA